LKTWTDERLVAECLNGNELAWSAIIDRYKRLIYSVPVRYHLNADEAADIFQAVCVELFEELPRLRDAAALRKWLVTVTVHQCFHWKRKQSRIDPYEAEHEQEDTSSFGLPAGLVEQIEREQMLRQALEELTPRCRKMLEMLFLDENPAPYADVANRLGLAIGSIGFIRQRCLKRLRKILEERGF